MKNPASPPRLALRLLEFFSGRRNDYGAAGDIEEYYRDIVDQHGIRRARRMTLSLTWVHRVLDGTPAAEFCRSIVANLEDPRTLG
jgi:hypothetical protein